MNQSPQNQSTQLIDKDQWGNIVQHFIEVLRINIFMVDCEGRILLAPYKGRYGGEFWENLSPHSGEGEPINFLNRFEKHGNYLEFKHHFGLHSFAIPMNLQDGKTIAYMIVGPITLNKRLESGPQNDIQILSLEMIKSILDLLKEISKYMIELSFQEQRFHKLRFNKKIIPAQVSETAQDIYSSICLDELLVTLLDASLTMIKAECGSIMVVDQENQNLTIKASRGMDIDLAKKIRLKIGDGIAGLAAKENRPFVINGTHVDDRIKHLLKRAEIKHSFIMPLCSDNNVFGVLNAHTKIAKNRITDEILAAVKNLSGITSAAIHSIQQRSAKNQHNP